MVLTNLCKDNIGFYQYTIIIYGLINKKDLINEIPKKQFFNATDLMDMVIKSNKKLIHYPIRSYWLDIGKHEDFEKAQKDIAHIDFD